LLLPLYFLIGCQSTPEEEKPHEVKTEYEAGSTNLSITSVDAWQNIAPLLNPNFSISGATAFSEAIPNTSDVSSDFVQALAAQLALSVRGGGGAALPAPTTSTPPAFSPAPPTAAALAAMPAPSTPIGQDPVLQYQTAQAIFQEVTLLNREVQTAANRFGYRPYVVRLKIDLLPYARNEPYDAYSDISFFAHADANDPNLYFQGIDKGTTMPQPVVIPLLVSDNLVGTHTATTSDSMRQLGFALTALLANVQANASVQYIADALRSITGTNLNSVETITRHTDNTIRVRMGGALSPDITKHPAYVMEARTYNVTVLLLVPRKLDLPNIARSVHIIMQTRLRNSQTGMLMDTYQPVQADQAFDKIVREDFPESIGGKPYASYIATMAPAKVRQAFEDLKNPPNNCPDFYHSPYAADPLTELHYDLLGYLFDRVTNNDEHCFVQAMIEFNLPLADFEYLWNDLAAFGSTYAASAAMLDLPLWHEPSVPPKQVALVQDDGKSVATATLVGGSGLVAERIEAYLTTSRTDELGAPLYAKSVTVLSPSGLQITFPTLAGLCASKAPQSKNPNASKDAGTSQDVTCGSLTISQYADPWLDWVEAGSRHPTPVTGMVYPIDVRTAITPPSASGSDAGLPQQAAFTFEVKIKELAANDTHQGTVRVFIAIPIAQVPTSQIKSVVIDAQGGEIVSAAFVSPSTLSETSSNGTITVAPPPSSSSPGGNSSGPSTPSAIDINLRNLDAGQTLTLTAVAKVADDSKSTIVCTIAIKPPTWAVEKAVTTP